MYKISDTEFKQFLGMVKLCKHCHDAQYVVRSDDNGIYIHCHNCKYDTQSYATLDEALQEWNYEDSKEYWFETNDSTLLKYNHTKVKVLRALNEDECDIFDVGAMYKIKCADGNVIDVFADELIRINS